MQTTQENGQPTFFLHQLISNSARRFPQKVALVWQNKKQTYAELQQRVLSVAEALAQFGIKKGDRVGAFSEKSFEFIETGFGVSLAGGIFVPINPVLRSLQIRHIIHDCQLRVLMISESRWSFVESILSECPSLELVLMVSNSEGPVREAQVAIGNNSPARLESFHNFTNQKESKSRFSQEQFESQLVEIDPAAIFYTSGSTGLSKGVVVSHRNLICGAQSVAQYLGNNSEDRILSVLPLSFDAGFSQLTTGFWAGAEIYLNNYLFPQEVVDELLAHNITGMTGIPPLWMQILSQKLPESGITTLRYFANTGGKMPLEVLQNLRKFAPKAKPFLMYGLTEAFRATFLPPEEVDRRPHSIGRAIPNSEVFIINAEGKLCAPGEVGELVQRGPLVSLGYWNDPQKTQEKFRPIPGLTKKIPSEVQRPDIAVFSGDLAKIDEEGFIFFIGRNDEMLKSSGYRMSPAEIEEIVYSLPGVKECCAFAIESEILGHEVGIALFEIPPNPTQSKRSEIQLLKELRQLMPNYMLPKHFLLLPQSLPRNANGKIDRIAIKKMFLEKASQ